MTAPAAIAGQYHLCPGQSPAIQGRRPVLQPGRLRQLLAGQRPEQAIRTLGSVFTLCAHAHQRSARQALAAAQSSLTGATSSTAPPVQASVLLLLETARDHLRSITLDWPQRLGLALNGAEQLAWLNGCPLPLVTPTPVTDQALAWQQLAQLNDWLARRVLLQASADWLAQLQAPGALAAWCQAHASRLLPARCLADGLQHAAPLTTSVPALHLLDPDPGVQGQRLLDLVQQMQRDPDFCQYPNWRGQCAENGPWTRLRHRAEAATLTLEYRISSRWLELIELSQATPTTSHTPALLSSGVLVTGAGQALAWCEMARGLLLHWAHCNPDGSVRDYQVIAPTEWNFHPQGRLAKALAALSPTDTAMAQRLAAAFDPCVVCTV
ncbi:MAG: nickel-dependent hydrogenase large subunit [Rhodoferax sp.]|nr:nickel-dependent hydrogenase large subunit [Rhodoferax sp.]